MPTVLAEKKRIARKQHKCDYCGGVIEIGEEYSWAKLHYDSLYEWKTHLRCDKLANDLDMFDICDDEGLTSDCFSDCVCDAVNDLNTAEKVLALEFIRSQGATNEKVQ